MRTVLLGSTTVHPRACGEHSRSSRPWPWRVGSSPRVRGTRGRQHGHRPRGRFIPARAGNTAAYHADPCEVPVHPRACGEHPLRHRRLLRLVGSSPRVRGTLALATRLALTQRFIPARAGNTSGQVSEPCMSAVHPRACGEHASTLAGISPSVGSSPRVRGTPDGSSLTDCRTRFIPARAGNTMTARTRSCRSTVHPRACGEHLHAIAHDVRAIGSSPRVRGTRPDHGRHVRPRRFIPARAGNTPPRCGEAGANAVHPRACGEH